MINRDNVDTPRGKKKVSVIQFQASQVVLVVKNMSANAGVEKILWISAWQPTPVFLPGGSHGQMNLMDYSRYGYKESDKAE